MPAPDGRPGPRPRRLDLERDVVEHRLAASRGILERHVLELERPLAGGQRHRVRGIADLRHRVDHREQPVGRARRALQGAPQARKVRERPGDDERVEEERGQVAGGQLAADQRAATEPDHDRDRDVAGRHRRREEPRPPAHQLQHLLERVLDAVAVAPCLVALADERLHGRDRADRLLDLPGDARELVLHRARHLPDPATEVDRDHDHRRHDREHEQRQLDVDHEQQHEAAGHLHAVAQRHRQLAADHALDDGDV